MLKRDIKRRAMVKINEALGWLQCLYMISSSDYPHRYLHNRNNDILRILNCQVLGMRVELLNAQTAEVDSRMAMSVLYN